MLGQLNGLHVCEFLQYDRRWEMTLISWETDSEEVDRERVSSAQRSYFDDTLSITGIGDRHRLKASRETTVY
jgi:hypothetical protein